MSDDQKDVLIAAYLIEDLAKEDFDAVVQLADGGTITVEGVVLVQKDADGEVHVTEAGSTLADHVVGLLHRKVALEVLAHDHRPVHVTTTVENRLVVVHRGVL